MIVRTHSKRVVSHNNNRLCHKLTIVYKVFSKDTAFNNMEGIKKVIENKLFFMPLDVNKAEDYIMKSALKRRKII
ncbi:MAG: hypothetical protein ABIN61_07855 [candidate division WOR-3 bacterium]